MAKLIYPELSYTIMGVLFSVHSDLGPGYLEKHYQREIGKRFMNKQLNFKEQVRINIDKGEYYGCYYADFIIEDRILLEIKSAPRLSKEHYLQVIRYLRETGIELGLLATFARRELLYKRILKGFNHS